jgi:hypothetical protein
MDCLKYAKVVTFCSDLSLQTTINPNGDKASLTCPPPVVD